MSQGKVVLRSTSFNSSESKGPINHRTVQNVQKFMYKSPGKNFKIGGPSLAVPPVPEDDPLRGDKGPPSAEKIENRIETV